MKSKKIDVERLEEIINYLLREESAKEEYTDMMILHEPDMRTAINIARASDDIFFEGPVDNFEKDYIVFERHPDPDDPSIILWQQWGEVFHSFGDAFLRIAETAKERLNFIPLKMENVVILPREYEKIIRKQLKDKNNK